MATETYEFLPEPLRSIAREDAASRQRLLRVWGTLGLLGGGGITAYLLYFVVHRASHLSSAHLRAPEYGPLAAGVVLLALGVLFWGSTFGRDPAAAKLRDGVKIVECSGVTERGGRFLSMKLGDGSVVQWRYGRTVDDAREAAAVKAVKRLPQWAGA